MVVTVVNGNQCLPYSPEFFPRHNLDSRLLARYAYGKTLEDGKQVRLLMTIYDDSDDRTQDIGVVEYGMGVYLIPMGSLEEWRFSDGR